MISGNIIINFRQLKINHTGDFLIQRLSVRLWFDWFEQKKLQSAFTPRGLFFVFIQEADTHRGAAGWYGAPWRKTALWPPTSFILQTMRAQKYNTVQTSIFCLDNYILWLCASLMRFLMLMFANGWYLILKTNKIYLYYCLEIYIYLLNAQFVWSTYNFAVHVQ